MSARPPAPRRRPGRAAADDPPPYAWLDDPDRLAGAVDIGTNLVLGSFLGGLGLVLFAIGVLGGDHARGVCLGFGVFFVLFGLLIVRMGLARRAWRRRHPGVDPLAAAIEAGVGNPFAGNSKLACFGRWLLVAVCALLTFLAVLCLYQFLTGQTPASAGVRSSWSRFLPFSSPRSA